MAEPFYETLRATGWRVMQEWALPQFTLRAVRDADEVVVSGWMGDQHSAWRELCELVQNFDA